MAVYILESGDVMERLVKQAVIPGQELPAGEVLEIVRRIEALFFLPAGNPGKLWNRGGKKVVFDEVARFRRDDAAIVMNELRRRMVGRFWLILDESPRFRIWIASLAEYERYLSLRGFLDDVDHYLVPEDMSFLIVVTHQLRSGDPSGTNVVQLLAPRDDSGQIRARQI